MAGGGKKYFNNNELNKRALFRKDSKQSVYPETITLPSQAQYHSLIRLTAGDHVSVSVHTFTALYERVRLHCISFYV